MRIQIQPKTFIVSALRGSESVGFSVHSATNILVAKTQISIDDMQGVVALRPYKKNEQSYIESFNRSLRKECLGWSKYKPQEIPNLNQELQNYLVWYHDKRPHMSLNMQTPNRFIQSLPDF